MSGIIHSHSDNCVVPSCGDIKYATQILEALDTVDYFYLPVAIFENGGLKIIPYVVMKSELGQFVCKKIDLEIL